MMPQFIINRVGERKIMFEKLFLAVTITFSLNFFLQVRLINAHHDGIHSPQHTEISTKTMVKTPEK
ncbi:hypothetical protein [Umezakia ovalisporum]|uniref:hypothetical protein n=1 Tax=Umezakia ovalisporum TaxID=75695 RepID=UPI0028CB5798|nr:hypothetical protein [Umezakia ovalisporum]